MREIRIEPKEEGKGRTFQALCLAYVEADALWSGGQTATEDIRPVWAMFAATENELRPFTVNLVTGRKGLFPKTGYSRRNAGDRLEILKSARFQTTWQKEAEGAVATVYLPDLFRLDPGMVDVDGIKFVMLPSVEWAEGQTVEADVLVQHARKLSGIPDSVTDENLVALAPSAYLFAAYLDRRTRCPLLADGRFYMQLFLACLAEGLATFATEERYQRRQEWGQNDYLQFREYGTQDVGLLPGVAFMSNHDSFEKVLSEQVTLFERIK